jgi:hypothetical protein
MKKNIFLLLFLVVFLSKIFTAEEIYFIYKSKDYFKKIINKKEIPIEPFNALKEIDQSQTHRVLINNMEKSILSSLFYIGDSYKFNNVKIFLKDINYYQIIDYDDNTSLSFSLGKYNNIILLSVIKFDNTKDVGILDKLASTFFLKSKLIKISGKLKVENNEKKEENKLTDLNIIEEYQKFIDNLKKLSSKEKIDYLTKYVKLNFELSVNNDITTNWTNPANLYYYKKGDYKSCAFFYYYSLKSVGLPVRAYLINHLERKNQDDIEKMADIFKERKHDMVQWIEMEYKNVNSRTNLIEFSDNYVNSKLRKPPDIFFYKPPVFEKSIFLIAVEIDNRWLYTTGINWIDANIRIPERACAHYARNGCYYANFDNDFDIMNNIALNKDEFIWNIFYP